MAFIIAIEYDVENAEDPESNYGDTFIGPVEELPQNLRAFKDFLLAHDFYKLELHYETWLIRVKAREDHGKYN